jgi:hypothetical protein
MGELVKGCVIFQGTDRILPQDLDPGHAFHTKGSMMAPTYMNAQKEMS